MKIETKNTIKKINSLIETKAKTIDKLEKEKALKETRLTELRSTFGDIVLNGDSSSYNEAKYQMEFLQYSVDALNEKIKKERELSSDEVATCQKLMNELRSANDAIADETLQKLYVFTPQIAKIQQELDSDFQELIEAKQALSDFAGDQIRDFTAYNPVGIAGNAELRHIFKDFNLF